MYYLLFFIAIFVALGLWILNIYNFLLDEKQKIKQAKSDLDSQLTRRSYFLSTFLDKHHKEDDKPLSIFEATSLQRELDKEDLDEIKKMRCDLLLSKQIQILIEELKHIDNHNYIRIHQIEQDIMFARSFYDQTLKDYNQHLASSPYKEVAPRLGFYPAQEYLQLNEKESY